jgi:capsular polysaccharide biosynthesis protein
MEDTISLSDILKNLKRRWKLIVFITSITVIISGTITFFVMTPIYQASTQILVNQKNSNNQLDITAMQSNVTLINTYSEIIKSPAILEKVIKKLELKRSVDLLNNNIMINSQENSQVFTLTVQDTNPGMAVEIANSVSETFQKNIKGIMNVDNVNILAKAELSNNPAPVKPAPLLNIATGGVMGLLVGIGLAFLLDFLDSTLKDSHDVEELLGLPVLGTIQNMPNLKNKKELTIQNMGVETLEA